MSENLNTITEEKRKVNHYYVKSAENRIIEIDKNINPSEIFDYPYLYHVNKEAENAMPYLIPNKRGKWMMFVNKHDFDEKWKDCCKLYDEGKLIGIRYLTCSTSYKNLMHLESTKSVILFHCGPAFDKAKMLEYGNNLLKYIPYCDDFGYMAYKCRDQIEMYRQKPIDRFNKFLYRIIVPRDKTSEGKSNGNMFFVRSENFENLNNIIEVDEDTKPTAIKDYFYLYHQNINILNLFPDLPDLGSQSRGKWIMFFKDTEDFDTKWKYCCKLYQENKLIGIRCLVCSTGYKDAAHPGRVIFFYCGPATDKSKMLEFGKNLLKYIPYYSNSGMMYYKCKDQTMTSDRDGFLYQISVPKYPAI